MRKGSCITRELVGKTDHAALAREIAILHVEGESPLRRKRGLSAE
jgi:hypothetical protein